MMESHKKLLQHHRYLQEKMLELANTTERLLWEFAQEKLACSKEDPVASTAEITTAWYWEQDAEHRFVSKTGDHEDEKPFFNLVDYLGKTRWEIPGIAPLGSSWEAHRMVLDTRQPFRNFEYSYRLNSDLICYFSVSGIPLFDNQNQFTGYLGTTHKISALRPESLSSIPALSTPARRKIACPRCGELADRIPRRLRDRVMSPFVPLKRYHCHFCHWFESIRSSTGS